MVYHFVIVTTHISFPLLPLFGFNGRTNHPQRHYNALYRLKPHRSITKNYIPIQKTWLFLI